MATAKWDNHHFKINQKNKRCRQKRWVSRIALVLLYCVDLEAELGAPDTAFFDYPPAIRKVVYTTNAIESLNYSLRKIIKGRGAFPHDDAIKKLLYLGLHNASKKWTMPIRDWKAALNQSIILFGDRLPV